MSISSYVDCLKNTALKNPIMQATNELLDKLGTIPLEGLSEAALTSFNAIKKSLLDQATASSGLLGNIKDSLPLLKAADGMSSKLKIMKGITPSVVGGDLIKGITGTIGDLSQMAIDFAGNVSNQVDGLVGGDISAIEGFVSDLTTSAGDFVAGLETGFTGITDGIGGAITDLKDYAFAKFASLPQPPALSELMASILPDVCVAPRAEVVKSEENIAREVVEKKYEQTLNPASPTSTDLFEADPVEPATNTEDIPAPVVNGRTPEELKASVYEQIDTLYDKKKRLTIETTELLVATRNKKYAMFPDYDQVKKDAYSGNLAAKNKYDKMLDEMERIPPFTTWVDKHAEYDECEAEIDRLQKLLKSWSMNNYANVPNGPPW